MFSETQSHPSELLRVVDEQKKLTGIKDIHHVHIWTLTSGVYALSAHLQNDDQMVSPTADIVDEVNHLLVDHFSITHTTLQLECDRRLACPDGLVCEIGRIHIAVT